MDVMIHHTKPNMVTKSTQPTQSDTVWVSVAALGLLSPSANSCSLTCRRRAGIVEELHADILGDGPTEGAKDMVCIETGIRTDLFLPSSPRPLPIGQGFSPHAGSDLWSDQIRDGILALGQGRHAGKVIETWQQD